MTDNVIKLAERNADPRTINFTGGQKLDPVFALPDELRELARLIDGLEYPIWPRDEKMIARAKVLRTALRHMTNRVRKFGPIQQRIDGKRVS